MIKLKKVIKRDRQRYVPLVSVCPQIGLTYMEVYHHLERWTKPLGIIRVDKKYLYVLESKVKFFIFHSPGYVPFEYKNKREPLIPQEGRIKEEITIEGTRWTLLFRNTKKSLTKKQETK